MGPKYIPGGTPCSDEKVACVPAVPEMKNGYRTNGALVPKTFKAKESTGNETVQCKLKDVDEDVFADELPCNVEGTRKSGAVKMKVDFGKGNVVQAEGTLDRLGEDMWGKQSYVAVPIGHAALKDLGDKARGEVSFEGRAEFVFDALRFYRYSGAAFEDVSKLFDCALKGTETTCRF